MWYVSIFTSFLCLSLSLSSSSSFRAFFSSRLTQTYVLCVSVCSDNAFTFSQRCFQSTSTAPASPEWHIHLLPLQSSTAPIYSTNMEKYMVHFSCWNLFHHSLLYLSRFRSLVYTHIYLSNAKIYLFLLPFQSLISHLPFLDIASSFFPALYSVCVGFSMKCTFETESKTKHAKLTGYQLQMQCVRSKRMNHLDFYSVRCSSVSLASFPTLTTNLVWSNYNNIQKQKQQHRQRRKPKKKKTTSDTSTAQRHPKMLHTLILEIHPNLNFLLLVFFLCGIFVVAFFLFTLHFDSCCKILNHWCYFQTMWKRNQMLVLSSKRLLRCYIDG